MKYLLTILFSGFFILSFDVNAQTTAKADSSKSVKVALKVVEKELDTEESLKYIGSQLLFQIKKRLHLTDEEEEKKAKNEKAKKLTFFGIEIEKTD